MYEVCCVLLDSHCADDIASWPLFMCVCVLRCILVNPGQVTCRDGGCQELDEVSNFGELNCVSPGSCTSANGYNLDVGCGADTPCALTCGAEGEDPNGDGNQCVDLDFSCPSGAACDVT